MLVLDAEVLVTFVGDGDSLFFSFLAVPLRSFVRYPRSFLNIVVIHISMLYCTSRHCASLNFVSGTASYVKGGKDLL